MNFEKWHDGIGYAVHLIGEATPGELAAIENLLVSRNVQDWRDVEALAAIGSKRSIEVLLAAHQNGSHEVRSAISRYLPGLVDDNSRTASLVAALESAVFFNGLSEALDEIVEFHPPGIIAALFHGARHREGEVAVHLAALLFYLHGKSDEPFDFGHRDLFLRFHTGSPEEREEVFKDFCRVLGIEGAE